MFGNTLGARGALAFAAAAASATLGLAAVSAHADAYGPYQAQSPYEAQTYDTDVGGVTVYAPRRYARQPTTGALVRLRSVSTTVQLGDLDLSTRYGARVAKARIVRAARDVCDAADNAYPGSSEVPGGCYATAVRNGLQQAQAMAGYPIVAWGYR